MLVIVRNRFLEKETLGELRGKCKIPQKSVFSKGLIEILIGQHLSDQLMRFLGKRTLAKMARKLKNCGNLDPPRSFLEKLNMIFLVCSVHLQSHQQQV